MIADLLDIVGAVCVMIGAFLCLAAAVGLARFPDVLSRMHAATKPQTLGLILIVTGVELSLRSWAAFGTVLLIAALQFMTAPVAAHLVSRTVYRSNQVRRDLLDRDDLADDLTAAGFSLRPAPEDIATDRRTPASSDGHLTQ
jgi:multicomponent Na+:H+ antiporter subunit G